MLLFGAAAGWVAGLVLSQVAPVPPVMALLLIPLPALALVIERRGRTLVIASVIVIGCLLGIARGGAAADDPQTASGLSAYVSHQSTLTGVVDDTPVPRGSLERLLVDLETASVEGETRVISGRALAWIAPRLTPLRAGDRVRLHGVPELPERDEPEPSSLTDTPVEFVTMIRPGVEVVSRVTGPRAWLAGMRGTLGSSLARSLPEPQASLARAVLLGQRGGLPNDLQDEWRRAGTAHLLAISGLHVGVLLGMALAAGIRVSGRRGYLFVLLPLVAIWTYALLAGFGAPVQRSAIMGTVYLIAIASGRQSSGGLALMLAAATMAGVSPRVLGEASFQLTCAAMTGVVYLTAPAESAILRLFPRPLEHDATAPDPGGLRRFATMGLGASLGAVVGVTPLLLYHFGAASVLSIPATLLALLVLPLLLVTAAATSIAGLLGELPGTIMGWLTWPWLTYLLALSGGFARVPFASVAIGPISGMVTLLLYGVMLLAAWRVVFARPGGLLGPVILPPGISSGRRGPLFTSLPALGLLSLLALVPSWGVAEPIIRALDGHELRVTVMDVGQGDAILIESPTGRRVLIDGGPDPALLERRLAERLPWWSRRLDAVILTHPSADHVAGLTHAIERHPVGAVIDPQLGSTSTYALRWQQALGELPDDTPVLRAVTGMRVVLGGGAVLELLNPPEDLLMGTSSDLDNNSVVARLTYGDASFLLAADIFAVGESHLVGTNAPLGATVLKVAHQGSRNASSERFLNAVKPIAVVITAGLDNSYGHPHQETLDRLGNVVQDESMLLRTDLNGTVTFTTDGTTMRIQTTRDAEE